MMSPLLLLLIAVAIVPSISAVKRCVDCNLLPSKDAPGPETCSNNCFLQEQTKPEIFKPWSKLGPVLQFNDAGIYYEPADMLPLDQVKFIPQPFYILNPAYQADRRISRSAIKPNDDTEMTLSINKHALKGRHNRIYKLQRKEENGHKKFERQFKKLPSYLDVDIQEPKTEARGIPDIHSHFENLKLAEQYLSICLDLHVLKFYRKNDSTFKNLKEVWDFPKFNHYESLSDLELENEIIKNCNHSMDIVTKSLSEIKDTWPKNNIYSLSSFQAYPIDVRSGDIRNQTVQVYDLISNASSAKTILNPVNLTTTEHTTNTINIVESTISKNALNPHNIASGHEFRTINPYYNAANKVLSTLISPEEQIKYDVATKNSAGSDILDDTTYITRGTHEDQVQDTSSLPSFYVEDNLQFNSSYNPEHNQIEGKASLNSYTDSKIYLIPMIQRTLNKEPENIATVYDIITDSTERITASESETVSGTGNDEGSFSTTPHTENRNMYSEANIKMSEILTNEYPNDTAFSSTKGLDHSFLNNNSIITVEKHMSPDIILSDASTPMTIENTTDKKNLNENTPQSVEPPPGKSFTGNLYFIYRNNSVPARFIQHPDGKINVGIDGYSLCDSVNSLTVESVLLNLLCNCIKFSKCTNTS